uniref:Uncharacterized protein n=1 Tax=Picea sitchensis TaxID=3332 RepID=A9NJX6_PICSI|nr:unknown [Picea sitchensis]
MGEQMGMPNCSGIIPQAFGRIKGRAGYRYQELGKEEENGYKDARIRRRRNRFSEVRLFFPNKILKAVKNAYVNVMFSVADKRNLSSAVGWNHQVQVKESAGKAVGLSGDLKARYLQYLTERGRWDDGADSPAMYNT